MESRLRPHHQSAQVTTARDRNHSIRYCLRVILKWELEGTFMTVSGWRLNRFERSLFWAAVVLAALLIVVRIATMLLLTFFRHAH